MVAWVTAVTCTGAGAGSSFSAFFAQPAAPQAIASAAAGPTQTGTAGDAAFCGQLRVGWHFCGKRDPQAKGVVERWQGYAETNFEPGRVFAKKPLLDLESNPAAALGRYR